MARARTLYGHYLALLGVVHSSTATASNFGDLPSVYPVFWVGIFVTVFVAFVKATNQRVGAEESNPQSVAFRWGAFLGICALGAFLSFMALVVAFLFTF